MDREELSRPATATTRNVSINGIQNGQHPMKKFYNFSIAIYLITLILTIPFYLLLYGASGHQFRFDIVDILVGLLIISSIVLTFKYLTIKPKYGFKYKIISILLLITLLITLYGGLTALISMIGFDFGSDVNVFVILLSYVLPITFITSIIIITHEIINNWRKNATDANSSYTL